MKEMKFFVLACAALVALAGAAQAAAISVDNFQSYGLGDLGGPLQVASPPWTAAASDTQGYADVGIKAEPSGNQYYSFTESLYRSGANQNKDNGGFLSLPTGAEVNDGDTKTLFLRFYAESGSSQNHHWGLTSVTPGTLGNTFNDFTNMNLRLQTVKNDATSFYFGSRNSSGTAKSPTTYATNAWYDMWVVVHNNLTTAIDNYEVYIKADDGTGAGAGAGDLITWTGSGAGSTQTFRYTTATALTMFYAYAYDDTTNHAQSVDRIDDVYISSGQDLTAPVPEPATWIILAIGAAAIAFYARRK
jgi:hypothetical protein